MQYKYNNIFQIPERLLLNKRITKAFFLKNFELSASEKKLLNGTIETMEWFAAIKPNNSNIPAFINSEYSFEELQIMICTLPKNLLSKEGTNCIELFQKHIPYPIVLIVEDDDEFIINTCDKRINQNDKSKRTIQGYTNTKAISKLYKNELLSSFYSALNFEQFDKTNLQTLYKSYTKAIVQYQTAMVTGTFNQRTQKRSEEDMLRLLEIETLEKEITSLTNQLKKESQLNNKVNLNIAIQRKKQDIQNIKNKLNEI